MPHYELSTEQEQFIVEAERQGLKIDYDYANQFLKDSKDNKCPAVIVPSMKIVSFSGKEIQWDRHGDEYVIYAPY